MNKDNKTSPSAVSAQPKVSNIRSEGVDTEDFSDEVDYGNMNLQDAIDSGYTTEDGKAVSLAKKDKKGSPTGALTDIGAGRSSVVHKH